jgi:Protein of unknown function (DUF4238)
MGFVYPMADHKNQHFVPRCVLKPFTLNNEDKAINLYTLRADRLIQNAPVKHQSARDYLYGEDGVIEAGLAQLEGQYSSALDQVREGWDSEDDRSTLRFFAYLQLRRTEMAIQRIEASDAELFQQIFGHEEPERPSQRYYMVQSLKACFDTKESIEDLQVRVVENRTDVEFVICDDPAIYTNKYAAEKVRREMFGVISSGLILGMPISPKLAVLCYDGLVYEPVSLENGRLILTSTEDVEALNELQYLRAAGSIYFSRWDSRDYVRAQFMANKDRRIEKFAVFEHLIFVKSTQDGDIFRVGTAEEAKTARRSIVHSYFKYPTPSCWISELPFRKAITTYTNGSEAGHVRKEEWLKEQRR